MVCFYILLYVYTDTIDAYTIATFSIKQQKATEECRRNLFDIDRECKAKVKKILLGSFLLNFSRT